LVWAKRRYLIKHDDYPDGKEFGELFATGWIE